jgi:hypothetical protein
VETASTVPRYAMCWYAYVIGSDIYRLYTTNVTAVEQMLAVNYTGPQCFVGIARS